ASLPRSRSSTPFPYTTLFRSSSRARSAREHPQREARGAKRLKREPLRANEHGAAGGRGINAAALRRTLQRASALAARALQHSAHYAGDSRTARVSERRDSDAKSGLRIMIRTLC